jgi:hypothetical protein
MIDIPGEMLERLPRSKYGFTANAHYDIYRELLYEVVEEQQPMTVRQVFYRAVVKGYVEKTEKGYGYIQRDLVKMRREGAMPYDWIIDASRNVREPATWDTLEEYKKILADGYRRNLLADHKFSIQVWLEKEALAGVIEPITDKWDVPLYCAEGYSSLSFLYEAGQALEVRNRPARIFHFGDYDPSGQDAIATVQRDLPELAPETERLGLKFHVVAVTPRQIEEMNLPTRPTKQSDTRAAGFGDVSVELDARARPFARAGGHAKPVAGLSTRPVRCAATGVALRVPLLAVAGFSLKRPLENRLAKCHRPSAAARSVLHGHLHKSSTKPR